MLQQSRGYVTGIFGKWHLGYPTLSVTPAERQRIVNTPPAQWRQIKAPVLSEYRAVQQHVRKCGFDVAERLYVNNLYPEQHVLPSGMLNHNIEWLAEGARLFMTRPRPPPSRGGAAPRPFFAYVGWTLPHNPEVLTSLQADPKYTPGGMWSAPREEVMRRRAAVCRAANVSVEALSSRGGTGAAKREASSSLMSPGVPAAPKYGHRHYPLALAWLDSGVDELMAALREAQLERNTLTIFTSDHAAGIDDAWAHGGPEQRTLFCEVGQSRAVFTSRYKLIWSPRIKPLSKGGTTDVSKNYQSHRHHTAYWRPLQFYDVLRDPLEQRNLLNAEERAALGLNVTEVRSFRRELVRLQQALAEHLDPPAMARECNEAAV